jgi:hypothetical protein
MRNRRSLFLLAAVPVLCLLSAAVYQLPPVHDRLAWRVKNVVTEIQRALNPPEEVVFIPQQGASLTFEDLVATQVQATLTAFVPSPTATLTPTLEPTQPGPTPTPAPTATPTLTPTPLPGRVELKGVKHEYQQMNNCGPTTLSMALTFWGWRGDQRDTRAYLRPNFSTIDDKNVSPEEMVTFVETQTELRAVSRVGGDMDALKRFIAAGFPVMVEKGHSSPKDGWMGHYVLVTGYDDSRARFTVQDSLIMANMPVPYEQLIEEEWRDFNYAYVVVYQPDREAEVYALLGAHASAADSYQLAAERARLETNVLTGRKLYFAWYNLGTNLVALGDYAGAAQAYDLAFALYPQLPEKERPWRMLWYQVGPYAAYYHTGRYLDLAALGNQTLNFAGGPLLEETYFWLGKAREALGEMDKAYGNYRKAVEINPYSTDASQECSRLGITCP